MEKNETLTEDVVGETEKNERLVKDVASLSSGDNALASPPPRPKTRRKLTAPQPAVRILARIKTKDVVGETEKNESLVKDVASLSLGDVLESIGKRIKSALCWMVTTTIVCALVLGILYEESIDYHDAPCLQLIKYKEKKEVGFSGLFQKWFIIKGLIGKVDFTVRHLSSSTSSFPGSWQQFNSGQECIGTGTRQCSAYSASPSSEKTWTMRTTFPEYVVALATIVGSVLFSIFGGVGIACLPLGLIFSFIRRPKAVITRSQYIKEATELGKKAKELKKAAESLHQEERAGSKGRKFRKNVKSVEKELFQLEEDVKLLEEMYPQGEQAETTWALTVLGYLAKFVLGILGLIVSVAWIAHIIIYLLINPPLSPFLNEVFIKLDDIWGLLGTAAFAFFCFYLLLAVIAGAMMLGLRLVFITIHPMKWGGTLMNSFLFNVGLILLCSISVIQFCSTAFAYYAQATAAQEIFGHTLESLRGIKYLY
ncbi:LIMR family protein at5g01460-like protein, partial [Trifolium pratense]